MRNFQRNFLDKKKNSVKVTPLYDFANFGIQFGQYRYTISYLELVLEILCRTVTNLPAAFLSTVQPVSSSCPRSWWRLFARPDPRQIYGRKSAKPAGAFRGFSNWYGAALTFFRFARKFECESWLHSFWYSDPSWMWPLSPLPFVFP